MDFIYRLSYQYYKFMKQENNKEEQEKKIHPRWTDCGVGSVSKPTPEEKQKLIDDMYKQIEKFITKE